ncbi:ictacalcin-like [Alosa sapidissima]|uniref:ictacalcin-like n=1 Tax=Alosa sapidissima TaxID=34773 RepID=UPI001C0A0A6A|nr:ictacalcin-like [Alosa sapidissima]
MTRIMKAMETLTAIFQEYAGKEGDAKTMSKGELKTLLSNEFGKNLEVAKDNASDKFFKNLDANADGKVDFIEFVTFVVTLTIILQGS